MIDEAGHVLPALAQRRDGHGVAEAREQVGAEAALLDVALERTVGGGDDEGVHLARLGVAHAEELARIQEAQQLRLHGGIDVAHLVEEQHAAVRDLEAALLVARGLRERALDMAEELGLHEGGGEGGDGDGHVGPVRARGVRGVGAREELLARARLAAQEHAGARSWRSGAPRRRP